MSRHRTLSWFYRLSRGRQAVLLANPHGYLSEDVARSISGHTVLTHADERRQKPPQWQLRAADANLLEDERLRLDEWWEGLPERARTALIGCRTGHVPPEYRETVLDLIPGGVPRGADLDTAFELTGIVAAYIEMIVRT